MDKYSLHECHKSSAIHSQHSQESTSNDSPTLKGNLPETASDKLYKKRKKSKSHHGSGSGTIWKNLSNMFAKSSYIASIDPTTVDLVKDKGKGSTLQRLSSFFKHQRPSDAIITPITNIGVSPSGYQAIVSEAKSEPGEESEIAMAVRLPSGSNTDNFAVTVELEALAKNEEATIETSSNKNMVMKCCEETKSRTVFTGVLNVPPDIELSELSNMPLYIVDSHEQLVYHPGAEMSFKKRTRPSDDMLLSNNDDYTLHIGTLKVKVRLNKLHDIDKVEETDINSIDGKNTTENNLINAASHRSKKKEKNEMQEVASTINVLDEVRAIATEAETNPLAGANGNESNKSDIYGIENIQKRSALTEVRIVNESVHHVQESIKRVTDLRGIPIKSGIDVSGNGTIVESQNKEDSGSNVQERAGIGNIFAGSDAVAKPIVNGLIDSAKDNSKNINDRLCVVDGLHPIAGNYENIAKERDIIRVNDTPGSRKTTSKEVNDKLCVEEGLHITTSDYQNAAIENDLTSLNDTVSSIKTISQYIKNKLCVEEGLHITPSSYQNVAKERNIISVHDTPGSRETTSKQVNYKLCVEQGLHTTISNYQNTAIENDLTSLNDTLSSVKTISQDIKDKLCIEKGLHITPGNYQNAAKENELTSLNDTLNSIKTNGKDISGEFCVKEGLHVTAGNYQELAKERDIASINNTLNSVKTISRDVNGRLYVRDGLHTTAGNNQKKSREKGTASANDTFDSVKTIGRDVNGRLCVKERLQTVADHDNNVLGKIQPTATYNVDQDSKTNTQPVENRNPINSTQVKAHEWIQGNYQPKLDTEKNTKNSSTQYTNNYFTSDKAIDIQCSFLLTNNGLFNRKYNFTSPVTSSSRTFSFMFGNPGNLNNKLPKASKSFESSETIMPDSTTSTATAYSSTVFSDVSGYYNNDLKVPLNSPISTTYVPNTLDSSMSNQQMGEMNNPPVSNTNTDENVQSDKQQNDIFVAVPSLTAVETITMEDPTLDLVKISSTEEELYLTDFDESSKEDLKSDRSLGPTQEKRKDKTLDILKQVRLKLEAYVKRRSYRKQKSSDWADNFANGNDMDGIAKNCTDIRNVSVTCNNPFNLYKPINKRCYEDDDDEYYESKRRDVRQYFQNDNLDLLMADDVKQNLDLYLIGDNLNTNLGVGNTTYQAYPLIIDNKSQVRTLKSQARMKLKESRIGALQNHDTIPTSSNLQAENGKSSKLQAKLNTLQQMYDNMCLHMKFLLDFDDSVVSHCSNISRNTIKSTAIEDISDGLTNNFDELKGCLSTINQILSKSTSTLQNITATLPSAWELFPVASDIFYQPTEVKKTEPPIFSKPNTTLNSFSNPLNEHFPEKQPSKHTQPSVDSNNINSPTSSTSESLLSNSSVLESYQPNEHVSSSCFKNPATIPTILEPLSDLLGDHLPDRRLFNEMQRSESNIYTIPPNLKPFGTTSHIPSDHYPKENQSSRSKNIYTVLPLVLEPTTTISDLFLKDLAKESQTKTRRPEEVTPETTISDSSYEDSTQNEFIKTISKVTPTAEELFPTIINISDDYFFKANNVEQSSPSSSILTALESLPTISEITKSAESKQSTSCEYIDAIMPRASELFPPVYTPFWEFPFKSSQNMLTCSTTCLEDNTITPAHSQPLPTFCEPSPNETEISLDKESNISSSDRSQTYFVMESEIARTIQELLKESKDIKEAVILNGGKEDAEPPFCVEYINILNESDPLAMCKIMEDVINSSTTSVEINEEHKNGSPPEDVKQILNTLLEQIVTSDHFLDTSQAIEINTSKVILETINSLYDMPRQESKENNSKTQIGDANNLPTSSKFSNINNDCFTCFCSTFAFTPKIPKTSFSFGETPSTYLEVPPPGCKTPMRRRDGLTISSHDNLTKEQETSRLFRELLNLQSDMSEYEKHSNEKKEGSSEEKFFSAHDVIEEFQADAIASNILEFSNKDTELQEVATDKPAAHTLQMFPYKKSVIADLMDCENNSNEESADIDSNNSKPSSNNDDKARQGVSTQDPNYTMSKSSKFFQLASNINKDTNKNLPSTSKCSPKFISTTEEEEIIQDIDLTKKQYYSSTEPEDFTPKNASDSTKKSLQSQTRNSHKRYSKESSDEVISYIHPVRCTRPKKKKEIKAKSLLPSTKEPAVKKARGIQSNSSCISLRSGQAALNLSQQRLQGPELDESSPDFTFHRFDHVTNLERKQPISRAVSFPGPSAKNTLAASDSDYEADHETLQLKLPQPKYRFKSLQELNTPEDIAKIEENLKENDELEKLTRLVLDTSSDLVSQDSSSCDSARSSTTR